MTPEEKEKYKRILAKVKSINTKIENINVELSNIKGMMETILNINDQGYCAQTIQNGSDIASDASTTLKDQIIPKLESSTW